MRFILFMIMKELVLQPRLHLLADMVPTGSRLADVGTDHGYLPVYLLQKGRISGAIASDIVPGPLEHARQTAAEYHIERIDFRLCAGLDAIAPEEADTIVIAGMGGETIQTILEAAPWTKSGHHLLLLQPMTKVEYLRKWLADNGYCFTGEQLVLDKDHLYPVFSLRGGIQPPLTKIQQYGGVLLDGDPLYASYLDERIDKLKKAIAGLRRAKDCCSYGRSYDLQLICEAMEKKRRTL